MKKITVETKSMLGKSQDVKSVCYVTEGQSLTKWNRRDVPKRIIEDSKNNKNQRLIDDFTIQETFNDMSIDEIVKKIISDIEKAKIHTKRIAITTYKVEELKQ